MKRRIAFGEKQPKYRYFPLADGNADVFIYSFVGEDTEKNGIGEETETKVFLYDVNELRVSQDLVTEDMVKSEPLKYLSDKIPIEENEEFTFTIVGTAEADYKKQKISIESPVGQAINGKKKGDVVTVKAPKSGDYQSKIVDILS